MYGSLIHASMYENQDGRKLMLHAVKTLKYYNTAPSHQCFSICPQRMSFRNFCLIYWTVDLNPFQGLEYADDVGLLSDDAQEIRQALNNLAMKIPGYHRCPVHSKCKVVPQDRQGSVLILTLCADRLDKANNLSYLGSLITTG